MMSQATSNQLRPGRQKPICLGIEMSLSSLNHWFSGFVMFGKLSGFLRSCIFYASSEPQQPFQPIPHHAHTCWSITDGLFLDWQIDNRFLNKHCRANGWVWEMYLSCKTALQKIEMKDHNEPVWLFHVHKRGNKHKNKHKIEPKWSFAIMWVAWC